jgi:hypothetical protein
MMGWAVAGHKTFRCLCCRAETTRSRIILEEQGPRSHDAAPTVPVPNLSTDVKKVTNCNRFFIFQFTPQP